MLLVCILGKVMYIRKGNVLSARIWVVACMRLYGKVSDPAWFYGSIRRVTHVHKHTLTYTNRRSCKRPSKPRQKSKKLQRRLRKRRKPHAKLRKKRGRVRRRRRKGRSKYAKPFVGVVKQCVTVRLERRNAEHCNSTAR